MKSNWIQAIDVIKGGGLVVALTDTIYGVLASALDEGAVEKLYQVRGRDTDKPCIVLISSYEHLTKLGVELSEEDRKILETIWPDKVSVVLDSNDDALFYLHRGRNTLAVRMVDAKNEDLFNLINTVGSLVAPSANPQGLEPARNIREAESYFGENIDLYVNDSTRIAKPSTLIRLSNGKVEILRQGQVEINLEQN